MAIASGQLITKEDIINQFITRVRDYVIANTDKYSASGVFNTNASTASGGAAHSSTNQGQPVVGNLDAIIDGTNNQTGAVTKLLKDWTRIYSRNHQVYFSNTGNLGGAHSTVLAMKSGYEIISESEINSLATSWNVNEGQLINANNMYNFIEALRNLWYSRCHNSGNHRTFSYYYCHSNHSSHGSHGNRGRR